MRTQIKLFSPWNILTDRNSSHLTAFRSIHSSCCSTYDATTVHASTTLPPQPWERRRRPVRRPSWAGEAVDKRNSPDDRKNSAAASAARRKEGVIASSCLRRSAMFGVFDGPPAAALPRPYLGLQTHKQMAQICGVLQTLLGINIS